jgi:SAM-dependent methyltransferase
MTDRRDQDPANLEAERRAYWNAYYRACSVPSLPSQFAVFVLGELNEPCAVVDVGCGNGRDAIFFARQGIPTIGIDGSPAAVEVCVSAAAAAG